MALNEKLDTIVTQLLNTMPKGLQELPGEIRQQLREILQQGLLKLNLVTREEFDAQTRVLHNTRKKLEVLIKQVEHAGISKKISKVQKPERNA